MWLEVGRVRVSKAGWDVLHDPAAKTTANAAPRCNPACRCLRRCRWPAWSEGGRLFCRRVLRPRFVERRHHRAALGRARRCARAPNTWGAGRRAAWCLGSFLVFKPSAPTSQQKTDGEGTWLKRTRTAGESGRSRPRVLCGAALTRGTDVRQPAVDGLFLRDSRLRVHQRNSRSGWCSCNTTHSRCMWATHLCVAKGLSRGWASRVAERAGRRGVPRRPSNL